MCEIDSPAEGRRFVGYIQRDPPPLGLRVANGLHAPVGKRTVVCLTGVVTGRTLSKFIKAIYRYAPTPGLRRPRACKLHVRTVY